MFCQRTHGTDRPVDKQQTHWTNAGVMVDQRCRHWPNIKPTLVLRVNLLEWCVCCWRVDIKAGSPVFHLMGARPYTILKAYKCFIRPVLEYGSLITGALRESQVKEMQIFQNKCLRLALGVTYLDRMRTIDLHDLTNVPMIKTRMTALAVKTFRSLENTQCFKDLVLNHEIVQKRSGSNTILDQLLAEIQADA